MTTMKNKYYIIADRISYPDAWEYIFAVGETNDDSWTTLAPYDYKADDIKSPIRFETKAAAQRILDALKAARLHEWEKNQYYYMANGRKKPSWKIYPIEV
jgi:hypothetical protein